MAIFIFTVIGVTGPVTLVTRGGIFLGRAAGEDPSSLGYDAASLPAGSGAVSEEDYCSCLHYI